MNPTTETNGKRGRKPATKWTYTHYTPKIGADKKPILDKDGNQEYDETKYEVSVDVGSPEDYPTKHAEWLAAGHRQSARQKFQEDLSKIAPTIATNQATLKTIEANFTPTPEQLETFKKGLVLTFPTEWKYVPEVATATVETATESAATVEPTKVEAADVKPGEKKPKSK